MRRLNQFINFLELKTTFNLSKTFFHISRKMWQMDYLTERSRDQLVQGAY